MFFAVFLLLFIVVPILEIWTVAQVAQAIGVWETIAALIIFSVVGLWLVKREGLGVWRRLNDQLQQGKVPAAEIIDGVLILVAGLLLVLPGFLGDVVGIALIFPPTRAVARSIIAWFTVRRVAAGHGAIKVVAFGAGNAYGAARGRSGRQVVDITEATDVDRWSSNGPSARRELGS